jgi:hypothetical protein
MESYYRFGFYSDRKDNIKTVQSRILELFKKEGHDILLDDYSDNDCSSIITRTLIDNKEVVKLAHKHNTCIFMEYSNDDEQYASYAFIVDNKGVKVKEVNFFYYDDDEEEEEYYDAVGELEDTLEYKFIDTEGNKKMRVIHTLVLGIRFEGKLIKQDITSRPIPLDLKMMNPLMLMM